MNAPAQTPPIRTTCPYCGVGCGVLARPDGFGGAQVQGDTEHPANFGKLCSKGSALGETLSLDGRLLHPMVRNGQDVLIRSSWDAALGKVAGGFQDVLAKHGPEAIAFYVSGQLLTEDYYVANKLMKGFLGSANIDTNSRLCMASSVAGHKRAFGSDTVPGSYADLDQADLLILTGSNSAWCHPVLHQRMLRNREARGARIVAIDPRQTSTTDDADLVLQIAPGTDSILFSGLLVHLAATGCVDRAYVSSSTSGYAEALARARHIAPDADAVAQHCRIPVAQVQMFFDWFCRTERAVTLYSQGVNQSAQGTDKVNAIINCHLATGRIGRPGMGPFSLTGQPNAMGGREVGGLANQLAAHMGFADADRDRVQRFWGAPDLAQREGLKAVDMFEAIEGGRIKALWIMATNPAVSMPRADAVRSALAKLDLLVVSDVLERTDTTLSGAHILLPASAWGEKDGTVTNSERRISRQRAFLTPPGEAKPDWWIIAQVGQRLGFKYAFDFATAASVFDEHARLSAFENNGTRDFDIGGLTGLSAQAFETLAPTQWPLRTGAQLGAERLFADGQFFTADQRAKFIAVAPPRLAATPTPMFPLLLNTGRVRDHWHTMTRTGKSARLSAHIEEPYIEICAADAVTFGLRDDGFARVRSVHGCAVLRVRVRDSVAAGTLFSPMHWSGETCSDGRIGALVQPATDPISGQPEMKATPVSVAPLEFAQHGFLLTRGEAPPPKAAWWCKVKVEGGTGYRLAVSTAATAIPDLTEAFFNGSQLAEFTDETHGVYRAMVADSGRLEACLFLARDQNALPNWEWLKLQLAAAELDPDVYRALLSGRAVEGASAGGPLVCACFGVGTATIEDAVRSGACHTVDDIGAQLKAGTNCGSCRPEIRKLIASVAASAALEPA